MNITVDSSVFLSSLLETDVFRKESRAFFTALTASEDVTITEPITVLFEVANILTRAGERNISPILDSFLQFHILPLDEAMIREILFISSKVRLKTADALVVWAAYASESTLITWDKTLLREARHLVPAFTPPDFIKSIFSR